MAAVSPPPSVTRNTQSRSRDQKWIDGNQDVEDEERGGDACGRRTRATEETEKGVDAGRNVRWRSRSPPPLGIDERPLLIKRWGLNWILEHHSDLLGLQVGNASPLSIRKWGYNWVLHQDALAKGYARAHGKGDNAEENLRRLFPPRTRRTQDDAVNEDVGPDVDDDDDVFC